MKFFSTFCRCVPTECGLEKRKKGNLLEGPLIDGDNIKIGLTSTQ